MQNITIQNRIYFSLVIILAVFTGIYVFLPQAAMIPMQELPAPKPVIALVSVFSVLIMYGGLGYLGLYLSGKLGYAGIWDMAVTSRQRFLIPFIVGALTGIFIVGADIIFSIFNTVGNIPHPPFPSSLIASINAGIGEEIIFRLFFISLWVWLISHVILKKRMQNLVFWIITAFSALAFSFGHLPSLFVIFGWQSISDIPGILLAEIILLNSLLSFLTAYYFRKYGFLAAVGIHFWTDVVWHVVWGAIIM